jgi:archaellum component FlaC
MFIFNGCSNRSAELQVSIDELSAENADLERLVRDLQTHLDESTDKYDQLSGEYQSLKNSTKPVTKKTTAEEKELNGLVKELNSAFSNILVTKDVQTVLSLFNEEFTSNVVMVSLYDIVNVRRGDAVTYPQQLEHILLNNDKIQYIEVSLSDIYHIEVRNNDLGIIYFEDDLTILTNESKKVTSRVLIQIVARKYEGTWKIGNYTSVNMAQYQENI